MQPIEPSVDELRDLALNPPDLTSSELDELHNAIQFDPTDLRSRIKLIGYFYYNLKSNLWQEHFLWLVENMPEHPVLGRIGDLVVDELDMTFYRNLKRVWQQQIILHPNNAQVLANAAATFMISDLREASKYVIRALEFAPEHFEAQRIHRAIVHLERFESQWNQEYPNG